MAEATKYAPINGGTLITDLKSHFSFLSTKRSITCAYVFIFVFIAFTIFLAFSPSPNSSSPGFTNIFVTSFSSSGSNASSSSSVFSDESYRSHFSSIFSYFFPNSSTQVSNLNSTTHPLQTNITRSQGNLNKEPVIVKNQTKNTDLDDKVANLLPNQSTILAPKSSKTVETNKGSSPVLKNQTQSVELHSKDEVLKENHSTILSPKSNETVNLAPASKPSAAINKGSSPVLNQTESKGEGLKANQSTIGVARGPVADNRTANSSPKPSSGGETVPASGDKNIVEKGVIKNTTSSLSKSSAMEKQGTLDMLKSLVNCNLYDGNWVKDESYPLYKPNSCSLIDEQFNCFLNGRPDNDYYKLKWKPKGCTLPRLDGTHMLELLRGKRLVFVGDSLNRNMWESLVCILKNSVKDQKKVYEESGRHHFRGEASYAFIFKEYNCRVEFFVSPFLVEPWEVAEKDGKKKETLRLDLIGKSADKYKNADIVIFNTGHWWTHEKTSLGKDYYQEGSHVYSELNVLEAFRKALTTWGRWVDANINPSKTHVMFRGYSASHFSGGQWNSGGACDHETEPIKNDTYLTQYPPKMVVLEKVFRGMKTRVSYLNITRMTDYRKDGHPSIYRKQYLTEEERKSPLRYQDCSHWCLPGVPDAWNELLYAEILVKHAQTHQL